VKQTRARAPGPWCPEMVAGVLAFNALGLILVVLGWYRAGNSDRPSTQLRWIELGVAGFAIATIGNGLWVLRGRRVVGSAARRLFGSELPRLLPSSVAAAAAPAEADVLLSAPGTARYHRPVCILLRGHPLDLLDLHPRDAHERTGRRACEVCEP
jgi:hypothetical protein